MVWIGPEVAGRLIVAMLFISRNALMESSKEHQGRSFRVVLDQFRVFKLVIAAIVRLIGKGKAS